MSLFTVIGSVTEKLRLYYYMQIFSSFENREATLTTVEAYAMECIAALGQPTIAQFANMMGISSPNAAYKIGSLIQKGYLEKIQSPKDRRAYHLRPTKKYFDHARISRDYLKGVCERCKERFTPEEIETLTRLLSIIDEELMPELNLDKYSS